MEASRIIQKVEAGKVISPFANSEATVAPEREQKKRPFVAIGFGVLLLVVGVMAGMLVTRYINDPYRTLEPFSVAKYLEGYQALAGSKFKAELHVEADLGWKDGAGRLMLFSTNDDSRPIAVMIPAAVAKDIYFTKEQTYIAQIEVKEGGLIYADSFQKN